MTVPWESSDETVEIIFEKCRKVLKVITYICIMLFVLTLLVLSKGSVLIAISNLRPQNRPMDEEPRVINDMRCNIYTEVLQIFDNSSLLYPERYIDIYRNFTKCVALPFTNDPNNRTFSCLDADNSTGRVTFNQSYSANQCFVSRNYWAWSLQLMISVPHFLVFFRCLWRISFKQKKTPSLHALLFVMVTETLSTVGVGLMMFLVLPSLNDAVTALVLMLGVGTIPSILNITIRETSEQHRPLKVVLDSAAILVQLSIIVTWSVVLAFNNGREPGHLIWTIPVSLLLISVRWWENYFDKVSKLGRLHKPMTRLVRAIRQSRTHIMLVASLWNIGISIIVMIVCVGVQVDKMDPLQQDIDFWTAVFNFDTR